jgi:uncharacterized iron-regulated membrane protein
MPPWEPQGARGDAEHEPRRTIAAATFRLSMAWLHGWAGLLAGWVSFFVFLTGTFGYLQVEVSHWMRPERPRVSAFPPASSLVSLAERRLRERAADAQAWFIYLPGGREQTELIVEWQSRPAGKEDGAFVRETLDTRTGLPIANAVRETGGGATLYVMHYALHYLSYDAAIRIVGTCAMFMLVAILSGIVTHRKIFSDFFTFRPGLGQRSWLDGHDLLGVAALPFHVMITWSGLIFFTFAYMPAGMVALYPGAEARDRATAEAFGVMPDLETPAADPRSPLSPLTGFLAIAEARWGADRVSFIRVDSPGRATARLTLLSRDRGVPRSYPMLVFDAATHRLLDDVPQTAPGRFHALMRGLHDGRFAGPALRLLYVCSGLAGTGMIAAGLMLWSAKRKAKLAKDKAPHAGMIAVDALNLGTIIGLPIGIAAYFWANRLLPIGMHGRAAWEVHTLFIVWGVTYIVAISRPSTRAWPELCAIAAAAYGLLPLLNGLTTDRHLGTSLPAGDWVFAGFDLSALAAGLFFAGLARKTASKTHKSRPERRDRTGATT